MGKLSFKHWAVLKEWADFGFERKSIEKNICDQDNEEVHLLGHINSDIITNELVRFPPVGYFSARQKMSNLLEWGYDVGALQMFISPLGSYKAIIRRKTRDLQGEETWICQDIIDLNEKNGINNEEIPLAHKIYECLNEIHKKEYDSPKSEYKEFDRLANVLFNEVKRNYPAYIMFPIGMKKMSEDYYKIIFEFRGNGVEAPHQRRVEQFNIDLFWDNKKGLMKCWGYNIESKMRQRTWNVEPSDFEEWFAPTQDIKKIVEAVKTILMTY